MAVPTGRSEERRVGKECRKVLRYTTPAVFACFLGFYALEYVQALHSSPEMYNIQQVKMISRKQALTQMSFQEKRRVVDATDTHLLTLHNFSFGFVLILCALF